MGEGEVKVFIDGDKEYPSICYTGTEDYFCGSYNFENKNTHEYEEFTTPYTGLSQVIVPILPYKSQMRFGMYRWHITDPIYFKKNIRSPFRNWAGVVDDILLYKMTCCVWRHFLINLLANYRNLAYRMMWN